MLHLKSSAARGRKITKGRKMITVIVGKEIRQDWDAAMIDPTVIEMLNELAVWEVPVKSDFSFTIGARDEYRRRTGSGYVTMGAVSRALIMLNNERLLDRAVAVDPEINRSEALARLNANI